MWVKQDSNAKHTAKLTERYSEKRGGGAGGLHIV